jgi:hypothetical protein
MAARVAAILIEGMRLRSLLALHGEPYTVKLGGAGLHIDQAGNDSIGRRNWADLPYNYRCQVRSSSFPFLS